MSHERDTWQTCPTCGGSGYIVQKMPVKRGKEIVVEDVPKECSTCDSSGKVQK